MKLLVALLLTLSVPAALHAQDGGSGESSQKWFAGGSFGLSLGNYTLINLSPQLGHRFTNRVAAGGGINLLYVSSKQEVNGIDYSKTTRGIAGLNLFGRVYPLRQAFIQLQPEGNYIFGKERFYQPPGEGSYKLDAKIVPSLLAGGGVAIPSGSGFLVATLMYDVLENANSPYGKKPLFNIGYNFNL